MNEQKPPKGIEWCRVKLTSGEQLRGYTWNPKVGCMHGCTWTMPNGESAECYAKTVAERVAMAAYPEGFEHNYNHNKRLREPFQIKHRAGIFIMSMGDLFGGWNTNEEIKEILKIAGDNPQHVFFALTKNPSRMTRFYFPENVWAGISAPPTKMQGVEVNQELLTRRWLNWLAHTDAKIKWMSIEPLTIDISRTLHEFHGVLDWAVIGAASSGKTYFPPDREIYFNVEQELWWQGVPVFLKGNMKSLPGIDWREEFPAWE